MLVLFFVGLLHMTLADLGGGGGGDDDVEYLINFDSPIYAFGDDSISFIDTTKLEVERYNDTTAIMFGNLTFMQILGKRVVIEIVVRKNEHGSLNVVYTGDICNFCDELSDPSSTFGKYLQYIGFPDDCPIGVGSYEIMNFCLDLDDFEVSKKTEGQYEAEVNVFIKTGDSSEDDDSGSAVNAGGNDDDDDCDGDKKLMFTLKMDLLIEPR